MQNIKFKDVNLKNGYWKNKQLLNENITINAVYDRFYDTGRIDAFKFNYKEGDSGKPHIFWDSDVAKWIEGASNILLKKEDKELEKKIDSIVDLIEKNQCKDGYFNIYFTLVEPENRFTKRSEHELYCAGHLLEAAISYYIATGKDKFLNCMRKYFDYIEKVFMIDKSAKFITPGHEEIELALVKMYELTDEVKYLNMANYFIDNRGVGNDQEIFIDCFNSKYAQNHLPVREQLSAEGHAVRACYLYSAMTDLAYINKDKKLEYAVKSIFNDIVNHKMYITGGLGSTSIGEAFTLPYDLVNETAYSETCASIAMIFFAQRMLKLENNAIYADIIERELYNGALAGLSIDGRSFFYENPLEINLNNHIRNTSTFIKDRLPITKRLEVFDCSCCPPNINRLLSSIGDYIYGVENNEIYINQFMSSFAKYNEIEIEQTTNYPKDGVINIKVKNALILHIRIPSWTNEFKVNQNYKIKNGYILIDNPSDVTIEFIIKPRLIESNVEVRNNVAKVAIQYGPFVYCIESADNIENLYSLFIDKNLEYSKEYSDYFDADILKFKGYQKMSDNSLYSLMSSNYNDVIITAIPYAGYANRKETNMLVWLNVR